MDYRILGRNNGDSYFCIVVNENDNVITTLMPMLIEKHKVSIGPNTVRETFSASQICPFTDDRVFSFFKHDLLFTKPMNQETISFYIRMINTHEDEETLSRYQLQSIMHPNPNELRPSDQDIMAESIEDLVEQLLEDEEDFKDRTLH